MSRSPLRHTCKTGSNDPVTGALDALELQSPTCRDERNTAQKHPCLYSRSYALLFHQLQVRKQVMRLQVHAGPSRSKSSIRSRERTASITAETR